MTRHVCSFVLIVLVGCRGDGTEAHRWFHPDRSADVVPTDARVFAGVDPAVHMNGHPQAPRELRARLDNGLSVIVRERHEVPLVASVLLYKVGSRDEPAGQTGLSHFLEHMMFKGTERRAKGEIDLVTMKNGGQNNAFTTKDVTAYHFLFPSDRWEVALDIEADRMRNCRFDPAEVDAERNVVQEEMRGWLDTPWEELTNRLDEALFGPRGYAHPIIGYEKDLDAITRDQFFEHYRRWYAPNNAILLLEGDLDAEQAVEAVRKRFAAIPSVELPGRPDEASATGVARLEVESDASLRRCMIGFRTCRYAHTDTYALHVLAAILAEGNASRLERELVRGRQLLREVAVGQDDATADSALYVQAELFADRDPKEAEEALLAAFARLRDEPVGEEELSRARNKVETEYLLDNESALDHASIVAMAEGIGGPSEEVYLQAIREVTAEDVQRVARKYLAAENAVVAWTIPRKKGSLRAVPTGRRCAREEGGARGALRLPQVERWTLENGLTVLFQRSTSVPVVTLHARLRADERSEPAEKAGLVHLVGAALTGGTATRSEDQVLDAIEGVGGRLEAKDEDVTVRVLSRHMDRGAEVLADLLANASFPEEAVEQARKEVLGEIAFASEDPDTMARDAFRQAVYGPHPYGRPGRGRAETVERIAREDVVAHHRAWYRPNNAILVVCGDVEAETAREVIERRFGSWQRADVPSTLCAPPETARGEVSLDIDSEQVTVFLGHLGVRRSDPDYDALLVMDHILGTGAGFTDRVSKRVRDELGLAYSCYANITRGAKDEPGTFAAYVACAPENEEKAVEALNEVIRMFLEEGPTDAELRDAKDYLVTSRAFEFETTAETATYWIEAEQTGLPADELSTFAARIEAVTREDVLRVTRAHLHPDAFARVRVGPAREQAGSLRIGLKALDAQGRSWELAAWEPGARIAVRIEGNDGLVEVIVSEGLVTVHQPAGVHLPEVGGLEWLEMRSSEGREVSVYSSLVPPDRALEAWLVAFGFRGW